MPDRRDVTASCNVSGTCCGQGSAALLTNTCDNERLGTGSGHSGRSSAKCGHISANC